MTIGGVDVIFPCHLPESARAYLLEIIREHWTDAITENDPSGEVFIFRDAAMKGAWDGGAGMVNLIHRDGQMTVVVDASDAELLKDIRLNTERNWRKL
jgi:hypothetical protein